MVSQKSFAALLSLHMALLVSASPVQQHIKRELTNGATPEFQNTTSLDSSTPQTDVVIASVQTTQDPAATATGGTIQDPNSSQTATATADGTPQITSSSVAQADWRAVGCYKDSGDNRILSGDLHWNSAGMNYPACYDDCQSKNKLVAGLQYGEECWCGNEIPSLSLKADDQECNMPCSGAGGDMCGGEWRVTVWAHKDAPVASNMPDVNVTAEDPGTDFNSHALLANDTQPVDATASEATSWTGQPGPEPTPGVVTESGVLVTITQNSDGQLQATAPAATGTTEMTGSASGMDTGLVASITETSTDPGSVATATEPLATDSAASQYLPSDAPTSVVTSTDATSITDAAANTVDPAAAAVVTETASASTDSTFMPFTTVFRPTEYPDYVAAPDVTVVVTDTAQASTETGQSSEVTEPTGAATHTTFSAFTTQVIKTNDQGETATAVMTITDPAQASSFSTATTTATETGQSSEVTAQVTTIPGTTGVTTEEVQTTISGGETDMVYVWTTTKTVDQGPLTSTIGSAASTDPGAPAPAATKRGMNDAIESFVSNFAYADAAQATSSA